jgi:hypothetical protein
MDGLHIIIFDLPEILMVIVWFNMVQNHIDYHTWLLIWLVVEPPTTLTNHGVKVNWADELAN